MNTPDPKGKIVAFIRDEHGTRAVVAVDAQVACPRCAAGRGCGAGIFTGRGRMRRVQASVAPGLELEEGDIVRIALAPRDLLYAALIVYGLPLAGAAVGAATAYLIGFGDVAAAGVAIAGLAAGIGAGRRRLASQDCLARFTPTVLQRERAAPV